MFNVNIKIAQKRKIVEILLSESWVYWRNVFGDNPGDFIL